MRTNSIALTFMRCLAGLNFSMLEASIIVGCELDNLNPPFHSLDLFVE